MPIVLQNRGALLLAHAMSERILVELVPHLD